jgi:hypothetical protein
VKDNDFIRACANRNLDDPFMVTTDRMLDAGVLRDILDIVPKNFRKADEGLETTLSETEMFASPQEKTAQRIGGTRRLRNRAQKRKDLLVRVGYALIGAAYLIIPMWVMVKYNTQTTALVCTSVGAEKAFNQV